MPEIVQTAVGVFRSHVWYEFEKVLGKTVGCNVELHVATTYTLLADTGGTLDVEDAVGS